MDKEALKEVIDLERARLTADMVRGFDSSLDHQLVVQPDGMSVHSLERFQRYPDRLKGMVQVTEVESFVRHVTLYGFADTTVLFRSGDHNGLKVHASYNHREKTEDGATPGWNDHGCEYRSQFSKEWLMWRGKDGRPMGQQEFAEFIEDAELDFVAPEAAHMLEVAKRLEATKTCAFKSSVRLDNGDREILYEETTKATAGAKGSVEVPERFAIGIPVFERGAKYKLEARLRYRVHEGALKFHYNLIRPDRLVDAVCDEVCERIEKETGHKPFIG